MTTVVQPSVAEQSEAEALYRFQTEAPDTVRAALAMTATRIGGGVVLSMRDDTTRFWSKALGFGISAPVTAQLVADVRDFYRAAGTPQATFQIAPAFLPEDWAEICAREGIVRGSSWAKLVCATDEAVARADASDVPPDGIRVAPLKPRHALEWGTVMMRAFGTPVEHYAEMGAATVNRPGWHAFAAWLDGELVGTGTLCVRGDTAQLFAGAVLPHARGRGAADRPLCSPPGRVPHGSWGAGSSSPRPAPNSPAPTTAPCTTCSASASRWPTYVPTGL